MTKRRFMFALLFISVFALALTGCGNIEQEIQHANDPSRALPLLGGIVATFAFLSIFFGGEGIHNHVRNTVKWTGLAALLGSPAYGLTTHSPVAGAVAAATGIMCLAVARLILHPSSDTQDD